MGVGVDFQPLAMRLDIEVHAPDLIGHGAHHSRMQKTVRPMHKSHIEGTHSKGAILMGYSMGAFGSSVGNSTSVASGLLSSVTPGLKE